MNKYLEALLATPLISALSKNDHNEIKNLLDEQDEESLQRFIASRVESVDELSKQLIEWFKDEDYNFESVIKQIIKHHRSLTLQDLIKKDYTSLTGKILRMGGNFQEEYEVLKVIRDDKNNEEYFILSLKENAEIIVTYQNSQLIKTELIVFKNYNPLEFIHNCVVNPNKKKCYTIKIDGNISNLNTTNEYLFQYFSKKTIDPYSEGIAGKIHCNYLYTFKLKNHTLKSSFTLEVTCNSKLSILSMCMLDNHKNDMGFTKEKCSQLSFKTKESNTISHDECSAIIVREKALNYDELKLKKLSEIEHLQDDIVYILLKNKNHFLLNQIISQLLKKEASDYEEAIAGCIKICYSSVETMFIIQSKLKAINLILTDLFKKPAEHSRVESIFLHLIFKANYLRWFPRKDSLPALKAIDLFKQFSRELNLLSKGNIVLFMGMTGAGKSASINFFLGNPLKIGTILGEKFLQLDEDKMQTEAFINAPKIGQLLGTSETAVTKAYSIPLQLQQKYSQKKISDLENCLLVDSPGFNDTRDINYQILAMLSIQQTIQSCKSLRSVVLVIPYNTLVADRGGPLIELLMKFREMFPEAFKKDSEDSYSLYLLISKCGKAKRKEKHFENRIQGFLNEDRKQLCTQKKRDIKKQNVKIDEENISRRIELWEMLIYLKTNKQVIYLDIGDDIERSKSIKKFLKSPGIQKSNIKNIFGRDELLIKLAHYINSSAYTNISIMKSFLQDLPEQILSAQEEIQQRDCEIKKCEQQLQDYQVEVKRLEDKICNYKQAVNKYDFQETNPNDSVIVNELQKLVEGHIDEISHDIEQIEREFMEQQSQLGMVNKELQQKEENFDNLLKEQHNRTEQIAKLQENFSIKELYRYGPRDPESIMTIKRYKDNAFDEVFEALRETTSDDFEEEKLIKVSDYKGDIFKHIYIGKDYYLVPNNNKERRALLRLQQHGGQYKAIIKGVNYKLIRAEARDRYTVVYQYRLRYDGNNMPYLIIQHLIPNIDLNYSTVQNLQADITKISTSAGNCHEEIKQLKEKKNILNQKITNLSFEIKGKKEALEMNKEGARQQPKVEKNIVTNLANNIEILSQVVGNIIQRVKNSIVETSNKIKDIIEEKDLCDQRLNCLLRKRTDFALILFEQKPVMESLLELYKLFVGFKQEVYDTPMPEGLLELGQTYQTYYNQHCQQLWDEVEQQLKIATNMPVVSNEFFYDQFKKDVSSWEDFLQSIDTPDISELLNQNEQFNAELREQLNKFFLYKPNGSLNFSSEFISKIKQYGLSVKNIAGDGNCFFHAVIEQLKHRNISGLAPDLSHQNLREQVIIFILENQNQFKPFIEPLHAQGAEAYLQQALEKGEWVDEFIILSLTKAFKLTLIIIQHDDAALNIISGGAEKQPILYLGYLGAHYVSLEGQPNTILMSLIQANTNKAYEALNHVWRGKYPVTDNFQIYTPKAEKKGGMNIGFIAEKAKTNPAASSLKKSSWLAKLSFPDELVDTKEMREKLSKRTLAHQRSISGVIKEKIAADVYFFLGYGIYQVPKHRLAKLTILNDFTKKYLETEYLLTEFNQGKPKAEQIVESVFLMSKWEEGYKNFADLSNCVWNNTVCSFMDALEKNQFVPEEVLIEGVKIPILGLMEMLAVSQLLGDTDVLGGGGENAGFIIVRDSIGLPIAVQTVKIDAGEAFNFGADWNRFIQSFSFNPMVETRELENKKDIQFGNMQSVVIKWNNLSPKQQTAFLAALKKGLDYLRNRDNLKRLVHRDGQFDLAFIKPDISPFSDSAADIFANKWLKYLSYQELPEVYGGLLFSLNKDECYWHVKDSEKGNDFHYVQLDSIKENFSLLEKFQPILEREDGFNSEDCIQEARFPKQGQGPIIQLAFRTEAAAKNLLEKLNLCALDLPLTMEIDSENSQNDNSAEEQKHDQQESVIFGASLAP